MKIKRFHDEFLAVVLKVQPLFVLINVRQISQVILMVESIYKRRKEHVTCLFTLFMKQVNFVNLRSFLF